MWKDLGQYLQLLPSNKGRKNKPLMGERRAEQREQRERGEGL